MKYGGVIAAPVFKSVTSRVMAYHGSLPDPGALTPAQIKAQEKAEARARARAVRRGSKEKTVLGEYRSELATKKTALPVRDSGPDRPLTVSREEIHRKVYQMVSGILSE